MENILHQIIEGKTYEESEADILTLCYLAALTVISSVELDWQQIEYRAGLNPNERDVAFSQLLEVMGKILCPIGDDVKQDHDVYVQKMIAIRLDYSGISLDGELQEEFTIAVSDLAKAGHLSSLETAIENRVYNSLQRRQRMLER